LGFGLFPAAYALIFGCKIAFQRFALITIPWLRRFLGRSLEERFSYVVTLSRFGGRSLEGERGGEGREETHCIYLRVSGQWSGVEWSGREESLSFGYLAFG
jgi:hypothetical protein